MEQTQASPIKKFREQAGLTQTELADKADLNQSRLSNYERLERTPDIDTARKILKVLKANGADCSSIDDLYPKSKAS